MTTPYDEFIGWMANQKEAVAAETPQSAVSLLERAKELRLKHLGGQHNQQSHGGGGGEPSAMSAIMGKPTKVTPAIRKTQLQMRQMQGNLTRSEANELDKLSGVSRPKARPKAKQYIDKIKNPSKKRYAADYHKWILNGREGQAPALFSDMSYMAGQAVRNALDGFYK